MAKHGYKLQEFVAHSANVNCLKIGKKTHRSFITGGDDEKVNFWSIGKPTPLMSLSGHTSPIESVSFDATEVLVAAGASSGGIKLWDLEETKVVRTLNGHRSYCTAIEFHPFGEFFASGSMDTNLKIWDIRKKGCINTYKGHRRAVSTIRFSPDGRWVVSGGLDNVVKIWDLTAGKLLHEFKFHEGHIRSMDFHPHEFLLATGSSDRTVKFWDLETFELIGSTRPEETGVRSITFHPDGRSLFCGLASSLKVYSWEPVICHDTLDMGWSTLGDLSINDGKLLGCSYYQNSVAVWVADTLHIEPHGHSILAKEKTHVQPKFNLQEDLREKVESPRRSIMSPDDDPKDIKNIYVDSMTPVASRKSESLSTSVNLQNLKEMDNLATYKQIPAPKIIGQGNGNSFVPRDNSAKDSAKFRRELFVNEEKSTAVSLNASNRRRPSTTKLDIEQPSITVETGLRSGIDDPSKDYSMEKAPTSTCIAKEFQKPSSQSILPQENRDESIGSNEQSKSVKYVNGVAVVHGRTRSLVERFEKREKLNLECQTPDLPVQILTSTDTPAPMVNQTFDAVPYSIPEAKTSPLRVKTPDVVPCEEPEAKTSKNPVIAPDMVSCPVPESKTITMPAKRSDVMPCPLPEDKTFTMPKKEVDSLRSIKSKEANSSAMVVVQRPRTAPSMLPEKGKASPMKRSVSSHRLMPERVRRSPGLIARRSSSSSLLISERTKTSPTVVVPRRDPPSRMTPVKAKSSPLLMTGRGLTSKKDDDVVEDLMLNHDVFLSSLRSRLTKLQVVRHFWEQNDTRGAINALRKLPDHAVQADVVNVLMERMESFTLDLFARLLPVLLDLLDSNTERHINVSLELILKLVAVFWPVVSSTISAPTAVGVDLHAEQRLECCNQCHIQLQKIHKCLPAIIRRGGLPARCAQELNVILQKS